MVFPFTGFAYLLSSLSVGFLAYRSHQNWKHSQTIVSRLFFYFVSLSCLSLFIIALGGLLFARNPTILKEVVIITVFFQVFYCSILGYLISYLKFPKISPWTGFFVISAMGIVAVLFSLIEPFNPVFLPNGFIDWDVQPTTDILRTVFFFLVFLPAAVIFLQQGIAVSDRETKIKSLGLGLTFLVGLIAGLLDFVLEDYLNLGAASSDISIMFLGISLFLIAIFTQKPPSPDYVKKIS